MIDGSWLLLLNGHNMPRLMDMLDSLVMTVEDKQIDSNFRLWVSAKISICHLPCYLLQQSIKVFMDSPKVMYNFCHDGYH